MDNKYEESLSVGIVQTTIDLALAWSSKPKISNSQDSHVWNELCKAMRIFMNEELKPKFVIIPELSLPRTRLRDFEHLVTALNVVVIAGLDYKLNDKNKSVYNQGMIFVPQNFFENRSSRFCTKITFGKTYPAPAEKKELEKKGYIYHSDNNVYVIDSDIYGTFGIAICYDFMDIERALLYRGKIDHLFVLAYNRDLTMFKSLADSLSRTIYCNVLIANTGFYGGSLAVSPYYKPHMRTIYEHKGQGLFTTQIVNIPVRPLKEAMGGVCGVNEYKFKNTPPGFSQ